MTPDFHKQMAEVTRLTRAGDLGAATALIQAALGSATLLGMPAAMATPAAQAPGDIIDVEARVVDDTAARPADTSTRTARPRTGNPFGPAGATRFSPPLPGARQTMAELQGRARRPDTASTGTSTAAANAPEGALVRGVYRHPSAGQRDYLLFTPPDAQARPLPLVVMLHGCTQSADDFAAGTRMHELARTAGFHVLYPNQSTRHNPQGCWNWFKHNHQERDRGEPALLAGMVRQVASSQNIDMNRLYVAGLSAGGAMAAILGQTYPDLFAAVGVHSGLAAGAASDLPSALAAMQLGAPGQPRTSRPMPTIVFHGSRDTTVHPDNAAHVMAGAGHAGHAESEQLRRHGTRKVSRQLYRTPDGHTAGELWLIEGAGHAWSGGSSAGTHTDPQGPDASAEMWRFFQQHRRQP
ncbi:MAG: PHB depolymerase family esterase [Lautropia sp.]|nr:PHB depolymerase family esterase [Lautropia sp.]